MGDAKAAPAFGWLEDRGGIEQYPLNAMNAAFLAEKTGQPAQAERWADVVDRWQKDAGPPFDAYTEAMAATLRAILCRRGPEQMRVDADEAAEKFAAANFTAAVTPLLQGTARILIGDLDGADAFFADAEGIDGEHQSADIVVLTLCERSLAAMARDEWELGSLAGEAQELRTRLAAERNSSIAGASALTAAELRLLPMLSTHLQLHEIAAEMHLSPHTIRAQGKSIYRKLGASGRSEAVARGRELGLLEG